MVGRKRTTVKILIFIDWNWEGPIWAILKLLFLVVHREKVDYLPSTSPSFILSEDRQRTVFPLGKWWKLECCETLSPSFLFQKLELTTSIQASFFLKPSWAVIEPDHVYPLEVSSSIVPMGKPTMLPPPPSPITYRAMNETWDPDLAGCSLRQWYSTRGDCL